MIGDYCPGCKTLVITNRSCRCPWCDSGVVPTTTIEEYSTTMQRVMEVTTLVHLTHPFEYEGVI